MANMICMLMGFFMMGVGFFIKNKNEDREFVLKILFQGVSIGIFLANLVWLLAKY